MKIVKSLLRPFVPDGLVQRYRAAEFERSLTGQARAVRARDRGGLSGEDPGPEKAIEIGLNWLSDAQDHSSTSDGGVARHYSLLAGWGASYPETTGYIIPTFIDAGIRTSNPEWHDRARAMLDWLVSIQLPGGAFQGGMISHQPVPVTFNTGQILIGLAYGARCYGLASYQDSANAAASWLRDTQDPDGCWRRFATPFAAPGDKTYETHVSWGLFAAEQFLPGLGFGDAGLRQVDWALGNQQPNGWFSDCCLSDPERPLTHTLGYTLRGILEAYRLSGDKRYLNACMKSAVAVAEVVDADGFLPGRLYPDWRGAVTWSCLTGSVQLAAVMLEVASLCDRQELVEAGMRLNRFVRRTMDLDGPTGQRGGVAGSFPIDGDYGQFEYLNWAAKFLVDSCLIEQQLKQRS